MWDSQVLRKETKDQLLKKKQNITFVPIKPAPYHFELSHPFCLKGLSRIQAILRLHNNGRKERAIGLPEGSKHSHTIIRSLKSFLLRSVVVLEIHGHGCMMNRSRCEHTIGSLVRKQGK